MNQIADLRKSGTDCDWIVAGSKGELLEASRLGFGDLHLSTCMPAANEGKGWVEIGCHVDRCNGPQESHLDSSSQSAWFVCTCALHYDSVVCFFLKAESFLSDYC